MVTVRASAILCSFLIQEDVFDIAISHDTLSRGVSRPRGELHGVCRAESCTHCLGCLDASHATSSMPGMWGSPSTLALHVLLPLYKAL